MSRSIGSRIDSAFEIVAPLPFKIKRLSNGGYYIFTTKVPSRYLRECIECAEPETAGEERRNDSATYLPMSDVKEDINASKIVELEDQHMLAGHMV